MRKTIPLVLLLAACTLSPSLNAQLQHYPSNVSLPGLELMATPFNTALGTITASSPELKTLDATRRAQLEEMLQGNMLADPEISSENVWSATRAKDGGVGRRWNFVVSQSFDWPGLYHSRRRQAQAQEEANRWCEYAAYLDARQKVRMLLVDYVYQRRKAALLDSVAQGYANLNLAEEQQWEKGEATILDLNKSKIEKIQAQVNADAAHNEIAQTRCEISALTDGTIDVDALLAQLDTYPAEPLLDQEAYIGMIDADPTIHVAQYAQFIAEEGLKIAHRSAYPSFTLGYAHQYEENGHFNGFQAAMTLPVVSRKHLRQQARLEGEAAKWQLAADKAQARVDVLKDYALARSLKSQIDQYGPILESTDNMRLLRVAYEGGEIPFIHFVQEVTYFSDARLTYESLMHEYQLALARLNRQVNVAPGR